MNTKDDLREYPGDDGFDPSNLARDYNRARTHEDALNYRFRKLDGRGYTTEEERTSFYEGGGGNRINTNSKSNFKRRCDDSYHSLRNVSKMSDQDFRA